MITCKGIKCDKMPISVNGILINNLSLQQKLIQHGAYKSTVYKFNCTKKDISQKQ